MKMIFFLSFLIGVSATADELLVHTVIGDQASDFSIVQKYDDHLLVLRVKGIKKREALIGNKNHEFALKKINEVLSLPVVSSTCENRDASYLEYTNAKGKFSRVDFCFTEHNPVSDTMRSLVNVMLISLY